MQISKLDAHIERVRREWGNVGAAVAVVHGDRVHARGFGVRVQGEAAEVDAETVFQIGSTTKAFTTAALAMLVEQGTVQWDAPITDYVPQFELNTAELTERLTLRDMLAHRSGVGYGYFPFLRIMDTGAAVRELRFVAPEAPFRSSTVYNNLMYAAAGQIVAAVSGGSWHDFVKQRLLEPLRMERSATTPFQYWDSQYVTPTFLGSAPSGYPHPRDAKDSNVAMPHARGERDAIVGLPWQSYDNAAAAGSIVSCARDMANWLQFQLHDGCFDGRRLLDADILRQLHAPQNECEPPFPLVSASYGLGWIRSEYLSRIHLAHGGGILGFPCYVALLPEAGIGIAVLSNGPVEACEEYAFHKSISFGVFDRLLQAPPRDWSQEFRARAHEALEMRQREELELQRMRRPTADDSLQLSRYAGRYADDDDRAGVVDVSLTDDGLQLSFGGAGAYSAQLEHWHGQVFRMRSNAAVDNVLGPSFVTFHDQRGQVASMSVFGAILQRLIS